MTNDLVVPPAALRAELPVPSDAAALVDDTRRNIRAVLAGSDERLLAIVGPCSIHDGDTARTYARWLALERERHRDAIVIVMRVYLEKARTRAGWKGLLYDPRLDGSGNLADGLWQARRTFLGVLAEGVPVATEFLELLTAPFLIDLVSWAAIGARTVTSPPHRWMASGWPCPAAFKNALDGDVSAGVNAVLVARDRHERLVIDDSGRAAVARTHGNRDGHIVLRGGRVPNYSQWAVDNAVASLAEVGLPPRLLIDCGHGNNVLGRPEGQLTVATDVCEQIANGSEHIAGVLVESHLTAGNQAHVAGRLPAPDRSLTDPCLGLEDTARLLDMLASAQRRRAALRLRTADR